MFIRLRRSFALKSISMVVAFTLVIEIISPLKAYALTSGPIQPEVQSFEPVGTSEMVDLFTGDFVYNIPLMDVGGYPINISYHSGIGMDQEASWVGLGWNINPGSITRNLRGIPDDFSSEDVITRESSMKNNKTVRGDLGLGMEVVSVGSGPNASVGGNLSFGMYMNNYRGLGYSIGAGINMAVGPIGVGVQTSYDTESGIDIIPSLSFSGLYKGAVPPGNISLNYNSREGLRSLTIGYSLPSVPGVQYPGDGSGSYTVDFVGKTFTPYVPPAMTTQTLLFTMRMGFASNFMFANGFVNFSVTEHFIDPKIMKYSAYGYLYAHNGAADSRGIQDLGREKEAGFSRFKKYLPVSQHTYDLYSVTGQGTGGVFRPHRGNVGTIFDAKTDNTNGASLNMGLEAGAGSFGGDISFQLGGDVQSAWVQSSSGLWENGNNSLSKFTFDGETVNDPYEPVYFKSIGERTIEDQGYYDNFGGEKPVRVKLNNSSLYTKALSELEYDDQTSFPVSGPIKRTTRDKRNQAISYLTAEEAQNFGLEKTIRSYKRSATGGALFTNGRPTVDIEEGRISEARKKNHISEITSINSDGTRYVYGIPAYNTFQNDAMFCVNKSTQTLVCDTGLITYSGADNSVSNNNGDFFDNYYSSTKLPPYAHSYLLTAVLSSDYIDLGQDGPTDDDYGSYTKINYTRLYSKKNPYKWRTPFAKANYLEGYRSDNKDGDLKDDKASYIYGEKEIWYINSMETKTHIAEFHVSARQDGYGANSENQMNYQKGKPLMKLDSISLYSKIDLIVNGTNAVPIKVVHFAYNYELCKKTPNSTATGNGKLTLKEIWFTYGKNRRGALHKYKFSYGNINNANENPDYHPKAFDRWGNYKPASGSFCNNGLTNADFPYVDQGNANNDTWAGAWHLKQIDLPSGGTIKVGYEADDYAYVQNRRAMQMFMIAGTGNDTLFDQYSPKINLFTINPSDPYLSTPNLYLFFKMRTGKIATTRQQVKDYYLGGADTIYFNCLTNLTGGVFNERSDFVAGYAPIEQAGVSSNSQYAWVKLKSVSMNTKNDFGNMANPISKSAWQYLRVNRSDLAYPPEQPIFDFDPDNINTMISAAEEELQQLKDGFNQVKMMQGAGRDIALGKSWIRLLEPTGFKEGGGSRVKKIELLDNWDSMTSSQESGMTYGTEYSYTTTGRGGSVISSGVASYEPLLGGDENPWRQPIGYTDEHIGAPNNEFYVEEPLGENYFPMAMVGYSKVTIRSSKPNSNIIRHANGKTVYQFYTAAEFPTITRHTAIDPRFNKPFNVLSFFGMENQECNTASQGYMIELNDMHGKPRAMWVYGEHDNATPITGVEYNYLLRPNANADDIASKETKLDNAVYVLKKDGTYGRKVIGEDIEMVVDANEKHEKVFTIGAMINLDGTVYGGMFPALLTPILPSFSYSDAKVQTISTTKIIQRQGLLRSVVHFDNGSKIVTENMAWDEETGEVLLTRVQNEHNDYLYSLSYPSHWAYEGMGPAYQNIRARVSFTSNNGVVKNTYLSGFLQPGDELIPAGSTLPAFMSKKLWVLDISHDTISVIYQNGRPPSGVVNWDCRIIRSGHRNMQSLPLASLVSKSSPLGSTTFTSYADVLEASAVEYSENWQYYKRFIGCTTQCQPVEYCEVSGDARKFYVDLPNMLLIQGRYNTSNAFVNFNAYNLWTPDLYSSLGGLVAGTCNAQYKTRLDSVSCSGVYVPYITVTLQNQGSCTYPNGSVCSSYRVYSNWGTAQSSYNFLSDIYRFEPYGYKYGTGCEINCFLGDGVPANRQIRATAVLTDGKRVPVTIVTDCASIGSSQTCVPYDNQGIFPATSDTINPYIYGVRGNWRPLRSFVYYDRRSNSALRSQTTDPSTFNKTDTRVDGTYSNYTPLWKPSSNPSVSDEWEMNPYNTSTSPWIWQLTSTTHHPGGMEIESKDALNMYSAALYGYWFTLPVAVAQNALNRQILFDGFEDYSYPTVSRICYLPFHSTFKDSLVVGGTTMGAASTAYVHSGLYSLKVLSTKTVSMTYDIRNYNYTTTTYPGIRKVFISKPEDEIELFSPLGGSGSGTTYNYGNVVNKTVDGNYILSYWVYTGTLTNLPADPVKLKFNNSNVTLTGTSNDQVVEGWKRVERSFSIPALTSGTYKFRILLESLGGADVYYDDIRIQPANAVMTTYVYDYRNMRLMATQDENNYSTFYEYNSQGDLVRVKRETEKGIMTVQESHQRMKNQ